MTVLSIAAEIASLHAAYKRAELKNEGLGFGPQPALKAALDAAIAAADANPANSTAILGAAQATFDKIANADPLLHMKARRAVIAAQAAADLAVKGTTNPPDYSALPNIAITIV